MLQRTPEWFQARLGKVTASRMHDVMSELADKKKEPVGRRNYRRELALERLSKVPKASNYISWAMQQGILNEDTARDAYACAKSIDVEQVGFVNHPTIENAGASPDGLVGPIGVLELKCPEANAMWEMLVKMPLDKKYAYQAQWQLACTQREWADVVFYSEGCPLEIIRLPRDNTLIGLLEDEVQAFLREVDADYSLLCEKQRR